MLLRTFENALLGVALLGAAVSGQATSTPAPSGTTASPAATTTAITSVSDCHAHGATQFCMVGSDEFQVLTTASSGETLPTAYSDCHNHGSELYCLTDDGGEVQLLADGTISTATESDGEVTAESGELNCHFHAGVEHCVGGSGEESAVSCERVDRDYNIPLRIGLIFAILAASAIGSFGPVFLTSLTRMNPHHIIFLILKQFGTGIIISTAFVHLYTHATLMFESQCLGELAYEGTTSAIVMAGLLISYIIEYGGRRIVKWRQRKQTYAAPEAIAGGEQDRSKEPFNSAAVPHSHHGFGDLKQVDKLSVMVLEAGLIFHSVLIGVTLVVAGDSFFLTLFAVIFFHQMFEGIALGTRIAELPRTQASFLSKMFMSACFAVSTPLGMAIGTGVLSSYNGNDPTTIITIGTLDAFSAGILVWVGVVEMWAEDWLHGDVADAGLIKTGFAFFSLIAGMILMSVLGKWA